MGGIRNEVLSGKNVDFTGSTIPTPQMISDGQLLIGSTSLPNIQVGNIQSPDSSITVGYTEPHITLEIAGIFADQYTTDSGTAIPSARNLNVLGGSNVSTSGSGDTITINASATGIAWTEVTTTSQSMSADNGYIANNAALVTLTLPVTSALGTIIRVAGKGAGGWLIAQNGGQNIQFGNVSSTSGAGGSIASTNAFDCIELLCTTANTTWTVLSSIGALTIT